MKNLIFKPVLMAFVLVMCFSCGSKNDKDSSKNDTSEEINNKDDIIKGNENNNDTFLTAKVDGVDFEVRGLLLAVDTKGKYVNSILMGAGNDDNSKMINIGIGNLNSTGTYTLLDTSTQDPYETTVTFGMFGYTEEEKVVWQASHVIRDAAETTGIVTITEFNDSYIEGTFNFTGINFKSKTKKYITDGRFRFKRLKAK